MFGTPERRTRDGIVSFFVPLHTPERVNVCLSAPNSETIRPDVQYQEKFTQIQSRILSELLTNKQLFRNTPSLESLEAITPKWGFVYVTDHYDWSPYTQITYDDLKTIATPAYVDLVLKGVHISRSSILPQFSPIFVEPISDAVIDFDWERPPKEIEEISDVPALEEGVLVLKDPAEQLAARKAAKQRVRDAYGKAREACAAADSLAEEFVETYDVSESESVFTGLGDSEDEDAV